MIGMGNSEMWVESQYLLDLTSNDSAGRYLSQYIFEFLKISTILQ